MEFGTLTKITDLHSVWENEAADFTPWLIEDRNIKLLSEAIGVQISVIETESKVGNFSADVFAVEEGTENKIIIENQLENTDREIVVKAIKSVQASPDLRNKEELIRAFIDQHTPDSDIHDNWTKFVKESQQKQIEEIIVEENLRRDKALDFMEQSFRNGEVRESGTAIAEVLPPMGLFGNAGAKRAEKKQNIIRRFKEFFERFFDISGGNFYSPENP